MSCYNKSRVAFFFAVVSTFFLSGACIIKRITESFLHIKGKNKNFYKAVIFSMFSRKIGEMIVDVIAKISLTQGDTLK